MPFSGRPITARDLRLIEESLRDVPVADPDVGDAPPLPELLIPAMVHAVHASRSGVMLTDADLDDGPTILYTNPACERLTGYTAEEVLGRTPRIFQGPSTDRAVLAQLRTNLEQGHGYEGDVINYRKDGQPFVTSLRITPVRAGGATVAFVATADDVTRIWMVRTQRELNISAILDAHGPPPMPAPAGVEYACAGSAADTSEIGGDWSDFVEAVDGRVHLVLGDASGHGMVAGIYAMRYRWPLWALLRAGRTATDALAELRQLNRDLSAMASVAIVTIAPDRSRAEVITAGHPDVVITDHDGVRRVRSEHAMIGVELPVDASVAEPVPIDLAPDTIVCLFSDGVIERRDESLDIGIDTVVATLEAAAWHSSVESMVESVLGLAGERDEHRDDANVLVARVRRDEHSPE